MPSSPFVVTLVGVLSRIRTRAMPLLGSSLTVGVIAVLLVACGGGQPSATPSATATQGPPATATQERTPESAAPASPSEPTQQPTTTQSPTTEPSWEVGASPLPLRPDGYGQILPTPPELVNRQLPTEDFLPPPSSPEFTPTIGPVPHDVLARSTWSADCPVDAADLRYVTMPFHGFDGRLHTGEMLVHADAAQDVVTVFGQLFDAGFPIEEMRVTNAAEVNAHPTGDGNNTSAFVCKPTPGQQNWSAHALGKAIDLNPFQNPMTKGDIVVPELASAYVDRQWVRPGMVFDGGPAVTAFDSVGWTWGGRWTWPHDVMHFSATGH